MPPNQKHTQAFTYEPPRIAQECITRQARGRESKGAGSSGPLHRCHFFPLHMSLPCWWGYDKWGWVVKVIKAEDQKRRMADIKPVLPRHQ